MKALRIILAVFLLPVCAAVTRTACGELLCLDPSRAPAVPRAAWALAIGALLWMVVNVSMPRPLRAYILAHELSHALWGWLTGARVSDLRVSRSGGSVRLSATNSLSVLGPYFSPLYTLVVIAAYPIASLFADLQPYRLFWIAMIGFTWGFHLTFTIGSLTQRQSDVEMMGRFFSYTVIYLVNMAIVALGLALVCRLSPAAALGRFAGDMGIVWAWLMSQSVTAMRGLTTIIRGVAALH